MEQNGLSLVVGVEARDEGAADRCAEARRRPITLPPRGLLGSGTRVTSQQTGVEPLDPQRDVKLPGELLGRGRFNVGSLSQSVIDVQRQEVPAKDRSDPGEEREERKRIGAA